MYWGLEDLEKGGGSRWRMVTSSTVDYASFMLVEKPILGIMFVWLPAENCVNSVALDIVGNFASFAVDIGRNVPYVIVWTFEIRY